MIKKILLLICTICLSVSSVVGVSAQDVDNLHSVTDVMGSMGCVKKLTGELSTSRWAWGIESYIYDNGDGTFCVVDVYDGKVYIDTYDKTTLAFKKFNCVNFLLEKFGGFYCGQKYNYIVYGRDNPTLNKDITTYALVKYDKQTWQIKGITELKNNDTGIPCSEGVVRMAEYGDNLYIRTSHTMYNGHQSSASFVVNTETMEGKYCRQDSTYVSHSFNQYIKTDGDDLVFVDHGDAAPRSVVLRSLTDGAKTGDFTGVTVDANLFDIPGDPGANCTGVTVGGFEVADTNYLSVINTIDHSKVSLYTNFQMIGLDRDERDVMVLVSPRGNTDDDKVKQTYLTDYVDKGKCASTPYLVKVDGGLFMVLWQEFEYAGTDMTDAGLKYVYINENGKLVSPVREFEGGVLSRDCQPVVMNNKVMWFVNTTYGHRLFYTIDIDAPYIGAERPGNTVTVNPVNIPAGSVIFTLFYNGDEISAIDMSTYNGDPLYVAKPQNCTAAKIIAVDKGYNLKPLCSQKQLRFE